MISYNNSHHKRLDICIFQITLTVKLGVGIKMTLVLVFAQCVYVYHIKIMPIECKDSGKYKH